MRPLLHDRAVDEDDGVSSSGRIFFLRRSVPPLDGTGQSIALLILEAVDYDDLTNYDLEAGLPDPPNPQLFEGPEWTPTGLLQPFVSVDLANGAQEAPLDVEMAHAMAPGANIIPYLAPNQSGGGIFHNFEADLVHGATHPPGHFPRSNQVSTSWFMDQDDDIQQSIKEMAAFGQSFILLSGDAGSGTGTPNDIRAYDYATLVGGTSLISFGAGMRPLEQAWAQVTPPPNSVIVNAGGGGYMGPYGTQCGDCPKAPGIPAPDYQKDLWRYGLANSQYRSYPDISMVATNIEVRTTVQWVVGTPGMANRTSASAPMFAGFMALVNQRAMRDYGMPPVGFIHPALYAIGKSNLGPVTFNDVQLGSIPRVGTAYDKGLTNDGDLVPNEGFTAARGYDMATGWGTPSCALVNQLASPTPTVAVSPPPPPSSAFPSFAGFDRQDTCALNTKVGNLQCRGTNTSGQNGTDANEVDMTPNMTPVCPAIYQDGIGVRGTASGEGFTCALKGDDSVWCWGDNRFGQLGPSAPQSPGVPVRHTGISTDDPPIQLAAGGSTACVVTRAGNIWCWGKNDKGQFGNSQTSTTANPQPWQVLLGSLGPALQVSVAPFFGDHACALLASGNVACWGGLGDDAVVLGAGSAGGSTTPLVVQTAAFDSGSLSGAIYVSVGSRHACAVVNPSTGGGLFCWGDNSTGELVQGAPGDTQLVAIPATVVSQGLVAVACGGLFTCTLTSWGNVECFGANDAGQVNGVTSPGVQLTPMSPVANSTGGAILAGYNRACSLDPAGGIKCWGAGPIGDNTNNPANQPTPVHFSQCF